VFAASRDRHSPIYPQANAFQPEVFQPELFQPELVGVRGATGVVGC
jgi:hypothetical protein